MKLLYEDELSPYTRAGRDQVLNYARGLVASGNSNDFQKANELSYIMRKERRQDEAVEIAKMMYEAKRSFDRLNLYFVAVVDQGDENKIRELCRETEWLLEQGNLEYQKHLFATWLKAANKILDDQLFEDVYRRVPDDEKVTNSYIISQFYVYLNRHSRYDEVCRHYESLPLHMKNAMFVKRYYNNARSRMGYTTSETSTLPVFQEQKPAEPAKSQINTSGDRKIFLVYGGQPMFLTVIESLLQANGIQVINLAKEVKTGSTIVEAFEMQAGKADFAIVLCTPDNEGVGDVWYPRMNVVFEYGYFMAKLGRRNVCLLRQENGKKLELPTDFNSIYQISMDKASWISELGAALTSAGFNVNFA